MMCDINTDIEGSIDVLNNMHDRKHLFGESTNFYGEEMD
jgi:hypothetical protein